MAIRMGLETGAVLPRFVSSVGVVDGVAMLALPRALMLSCSRLL